LKCVHLWEPGLPAMTIAQTHHFYSDRCSSNPRIIAVFLEGTLSRGQ
jgi:hypothetical protein